MPRTLHRKWLSLLALAVSPTLAVAQGAASQTHTVRGGDTLWDLAKQYRGDPFLWPDVYRLNTSVVEDPHWIYPGEVIRLAGGDSVVSVPATDTPAPPVAEAATPSPAPVADPPVSAPADASVADASVADANAGPAGQQTLAELTAGAGDAGEQSGTLFGPRRTDGLRETIKAYTEKEYRSLRRSEFYSSGFLTEGKDLPFGKVLGPVTPSQISSTSANAHALPYSIIAVDAPRGGTYQVGDTLLLLQLGGELRPRGDVIVPTGLAQVTDTVQGRYLASVIAIYGPIRNGQRVLPAEKFTPSGTTHAVPVSEGVRATVLGGPGRQDLKAPQMVVFLDQGREDGVAPGDLFEVRRTPERLSDGSQRANELMATLQVVHVRDHSATARILNIISPDIPPGTRARQIAKLPS